MPFLKDISTTEIIVIGVILVFLFGGKKLSQWAKGLGETGHELKKIKRDFKDAYDGLENDEPPTISEPKTRKGVE